MNRKLTSGTYTPTPSFLSIPEHICVADAETGTVVAIVGPNDPAENLAETIEIARLFIASPDLLEQLKQAEALLARINYAFYVKGTRKALLEVMEETKPALAPIRTAIAKAGQQ